MADRRAFLSGLVSLPLIGGGVTLIGRPAAAVPLVQAAALPAFDDPRQRARYAWKAFSTAMDDLTASAHGWRIQAQNTRGAGYVPPIAYLDLQASLYEVGSRISDDRDLVIERHIPVDLGDELARSATVRRRRD